MKVILCKTIDKLGNAGDVITVKEGYARNFLIPNNSAKEATPGNMKLLETIKKKQAAEDLKKISDAQAIAQKLSAVSLILSAEAGEEDKLFGSVSSEEIAETLLRENIKIDKRDLILDAPIKKLGLYQVTVKLHPEVKAIFTVSIVKK